MKRYVATLILSLAAVTISEQPCFELPSAQGQVRLGINDYPEDLKSPQPLDDGLTQLQPANGVALPDVRTKQYEAQLQRIRAKMSELRRKRLQQIEAKRKLEELPPPTQTLPVSIDTNIEPPKPTIPAQEAVAGPALVPPAKLTPVAPPPTPEVTTPAPSEMESPVLLSSEPIDSLSFADNLFAQGKIDVARPVYESLVKKPQKAEDLVWIQYQLASCYRLENNFKDATKYYRLVVSDKSDTYWPSRARWWITYITRLELVNQRRQGIEEQIKSIQEQSVELQKP